MAYVGCTSLEQPPILSSRRTARGEQLWVVHYADRYRYFDRVVPRLLNGDPVEGWLRTLKAGRARNVATFGRAVRGLSAKDLQTIFHARYPPIGDHLVPELQIQERAQRLVTTALREARFRDDVLSHYGRRCAITGFASESRSPTKLFGLLDAAHIRPVWAQGPDSVANGLALTPTVHRLFDRGLLTLEYADGRPVVLVSPRIEQSMIGSPDGRTALVLENGMPIYVPDDRSLWPHPDALAYHRREIYVGE